jgi:hypothetical protein
VIAVFQYFPWLENSFVEKNAAAITARTPAIEKHTVKSVPNHEPEFFLNPLC